MAALSEAAGTGHLDLVLDIGKTRTRLFVLDGQGVVQAQAEQASTSVSAGAYLALDVPGITAWLEHAIVALGPLRARLQRAVVSAHGAAFAALDGDRLAWPVPDYEFEGFDDRSACWPETIGPFEETQSPDLPRGLNAATQFDWLERQGHAVRTKQLLPYPQYWAWWLSGVAASEPSSLGCHTHLWNPTAGVFSALAQRRGWAAAMAPLRRAWDLLGPVRPTLAARLGLPVALQVCVGVHDSNACLARYLRSHPRLTLVTTGTWVVVMAPGAPAQALGARRDMLANVSVRQEAVPTGRFMGGRELLHLCAGADPASANLRDLQGLLSRGLMAEPGFEVQGGPFRARTGCVRDLRGPVALHSLSPAERATLAALYSAQVTAWVVDRLGGLGPVVVEGPFAHNAVYTQVLAQLCSPSPVLTSHDELEGTARGAWMLTHWTEPGIRPSAAAQVQGGGLPGLQALHQRWRAAVDERALT